MRSQTNVLPSYDFSDALGLSPQERLETCLRLLRARFQDWQVRWPGDVRPIPITGAPEEELQALEDENGAPLPVEYRTFLSRCRYLTLDDGHTVWGANQEIDGDSSPWLSMEHSTAAPCWVIGDYWRYADGDQLLILPEQPGQPVMLYLHEHGPVVEAFAPCFSLALWRIAHEEW